MNQLNTLTPVQLRELEAELRYELARLERVATPELASAGVPVSGTFTAPSAAEPGEREDLAVALQSRALARYAEVLDALSRLDKGTYGTCVRCSGNIPYGRLLVMPETAHCVTCRPAA